MTRRHRKRTTPPTIFDAPGVDHLRHLAGCSLTTPEIAEPHAARCTIRTMCARYGVPIGDDNVALVILPPAIMKRLRHEAKQRHMARSKLLSRLLTIVATDNLFDAVLDARVEARAREINARA